MKSDVAPQIPTRVKFAWATGLGGLLVILLGLGFYSAQVLRRARTAEAERTRTYLARREALTSVRNSIYATGTNLRDYLVDPDESRYRLHAEPARKSSVLSQQSLDRYRTAEPASGALARLERGVGEYERLTQRALELAGTERRADGYRLFAEEIGPARDAMLGVIQDLASQDDASLRSSIEETAAFLAELESRLFEAISLSLALGFVVAGLAYRYLLKLESEAATRYRQSMEATAQLEQLSHRLLAVQEDERKALARELHDEVGQSLGALLVDLGQAKNELSGDLNETLARLKAASDLGERALQSVRDISLLLRPSMLDDLGLLPALHWQAREVTRRTGMLVTVSSDEDDLDLEEELRTTVYRVVQEALQNAARHSGAQATEVAIAMHGQHLHIMVRDNGRGFDPSHTKGMGLLGMQERVSHFGGKLRIVSTPRTGTTLTIDLPIEPDLTSGEEPRSASSSYGEPKHYENPNLAGG
jgi:signal transduction histidine kinase